MGLTYYDTATITAIKSFIIQAPECDTYFHCNKFPVMSIINLKPILNRTCNLLHWVLRNLRGHYQSKGYHLDKPARKASREQHCRFASPGPNVIKCFPAIISKFL
jgi:hypothetical protein